MTRYALLVFIVSLAVAVAEMEVAPTYVSCKGKAKAVPGSMYIFNSDGSNGKRKCQFKVKLPENSVGYLKCPHLKMMDCKKEYITINKEKVCSQDDLMEMEFTKGTVALVHIRKKLKKSDCSGGYNCVLVVKSKMDSTTEPEPETTQPPGGTTAGPDTTTVAPVPETTTAGGFNPRCACGNLPLGPLLPQERAWGTQVTPLTPYSAPWIARIEIMEGTTLFHYCTGVIVHEQFILTSELCAQLYVKDQVRVVLGDHGLHAEEEGSITINIPPENIYALGERTEEWLNNVALLKLPQRIEYNERMSPVCLDDKDVVELEPATFVSWGYEPGWVEIENLNGFKQNTINYDRCWFGILNEVDFPGRKTMDPDTMACFIGKEEFDYCGGDEGAPILYENPETGCMTLIGIENYYYQCAALLPHVFTRIYPHLQAILDIIEANKD